MVKNSNAFALPTLDASVGRVARPLGFHLAMVLDIHSTGGFLFHGSLQRY